MNHPEPTFKPIFGSDWDKLPPVFQKRYVNHPFSADLATVEGKMDIDFAKIMACFMPFFKLFHVLVPYKGNDIPVKVNFRSEKDSAAVCLDRTFFFPDKKPYEFNSRMLLIKENEVIERMALGLGWRTHYYYDGTKVIMEHRGYVWQIFGLNIPLPLEIFIGRGHAEEEVVDDNAYRVTMAMLHPWLGVLYSYSGVFTFKRLPT
jgi:hypothetical protein